jgi:hypothetical protein
MPDKNGNYTEEKMQLISESSSRIDVYDKDGKRIVQYGIKVDDKIKSTHRIREISVEFQEDLNSGLLDPILSNVHRDNNLTVEIRRNYINIYYRGGNILRIRKKNTGYNFEFDLRYIKQKYSDAKEMISKLPKHIAVRDDAQAWSDKIPAIKAEMDTYFVTHKKTEREFQQLVVRENNIGGIAKKTDYYICDIEYQVGDTRLDLVAAKCTGRGKYRLALIEMKYADSALGGKAGIIDHVRKANEYFKGNNIENIKNEMYGILETKRTLGLVDDLPAQFEFTHERPEFIFLLANHKPASSSLDNELNKLEKEDFYIDFCKMADLKLATASFFGYGLFNDCIYTHNEFKEVNKALLEIADRRKK